MKFFSLFKSSGKPPGATTITGHNITTELLESLERSNELINLLDKQSFFDVLKLNRAILYIQVDWSGPERVSRYCVYKILSELGKGSVPVFKIDCTDQSKKYFDNWLIEQNGQTQYFSPGGWGETLLISEGRLIDFITNPGQLGLEKTKAKICDWINISDTRVSPKVNRKW